MACRAVVSAISALQRQVSDLSAENLSVRKLNHKLTQNDLSTSHENTAKELDRLSATTPTDTLGVFLKVDQRLASWPLSEVDELCSDRNILTRNSHKRGEKYHQQAIQAELHGPDVFLLVLASSSRAMHYTLFLSPHIFLFAADLNAELHK